jgi:exopolyphosphatase/guanosine-5'-triphosphate,3'-diphosphate pyrophosphatase
MTESFLTHDPPTPAELNAAREHAHDTLADFIVAFPERPGTLLAVAGAATSVVSMRDRLTTYDPRLVHKARVTVGELRDVSDELAALPLERRKARIGLEPARASVIVGGLIILEQILLLSGLDSFVGSETDILHGIALSQAGLETHLPGCW